MIQQAANLKHMDATYFFGIRYLDGTDGFQINQEKAEYYLSISASQGLSQAQAILGSLYVQSKKSPTQIEKGLELLHKAADAGYRDAHLFLGQSYLNGNYLAEIHQDVPKGVKHLIIAADNGCPQSQFILAILYKDGFIIQKDLQKSREYFTKSLLQGYKEAVEYSKKIRAVR